MKGNRLHQFHSCSLVAPVILYKTPQVCPPTLPLGALCLREPAVTGSDLAEVGEGGVQVGVHACGGLVGDFDGVLQDALGNQVLLRGPGGLGADKHPVVWVTVAARPFQKLLEGTQPPSHQVHVLTERPAPR